MKSWRKAIVGMQATVGEAIAAIESGSIQVALLVDGSNRLLGVVTDGDIRRGLLRGIALSARATDVMNQKPVSAPATLSREERLHLMRQKFIKQLPLLDDSGQLVGVETFDELIDAPNYPNPVLIMAGGMGERLGALTRDRPKPMLECRGTAVAGNHHPQRGAAGFPQHLHICELQGRDDRRSFRRRFRAGGCDPICPRDRTSGNCRSARAVADPPDLPMVVTNGDILTTINYGALLDFHNDTPADATMAVREHKVHVPYGVVSASEGYLRAIREKPTNPGSSAPGSTSSAARHSIMSSAALGSTCRRCWSVSSPTKAASRSIRSGNTGSISAGWKILNRPTRSFTRSSRDLAERDRRRPRFDRTTPCARAA